MGQSCDPCSKGPEIDRQEELFQQAFGGLASDAALAAVVADLAKLVEEHPYLKPSGDEFAPHQLLYWVRKCREFLLAHNAEEARSCFERIQRSLERELAQVKDAFFAVRS